MSIIKKIDIKSNGLISQKCSHKLDEDDKQENKC